eukprot:10528054-Heterocapsa_arctica.AAC.2
MRQRVYDDLNTKDLALYMAREEAKRGIRDSLSIEVAHQMKLLKQHRYDTQRDTDNEAHRERAVMTNQLQVEFEQEQMRAYQYYNKLI